MFADAKTSAGAPFVICVASAFEPAKEYVFAVGSIFGNTSVSDAAGVHRDPGGRMVRLGGGAAGAHADESASATRALGAPADDWTARELLSVLIR